MELYVHAGRTRAALAALLSSGPLCDDDAITAINICCCYIANRTKKEARGMQNACDESCGCPLVAAAAHQSAAVVMHLLSVGEDPNCARCVATLLLDEASDDDDGGDDEKNPNPHNHDQQQQKPQCYCGGDIPHLSAAVPRTLLPPS